MSTFGGKCHIHIPTSFIENALFFSKNRKNCRNNFSAFFSLLTAPGLRFSSQVKGQELKYLNEYLQKYTGQIKTPHGYGVAHCPNPGTAKNRC